MGIESATYLSQLDPANPAGSDPLADADNHLRLIKSVLKNTFPNLDGPVSAKTTDFLGLVPVGSVLAWMGVKANIPSGWAACEGQTVNLTDGSGTLVLPDLRDVFIVGAGTRRPYGTFVGNDTSTITTATGGTHKHGARSQGAGEHSHFGGTQGTALSLDQIPSHPHRLSFRPSGSGRVVVGNTGMQVLGIDPVEGDTYQAGGGQAHNHPIQSDGNHTHGIEVDDGGAHNHTADVPVTPRAYSLLYIMKI